MRKLSILEPLLLFAFLMLYIWVLRFQYPWLVLAIVLWLAFSQWRRKPRFKARNFTECLRHYGAVLGAISIALLALAFAFHTWREIPLERAGLALLAYLPWGLAQQYALNAYFLECFEEALGARAAAIVTAVLFSIVHAPNFFLMAVTLIGAWCAIQAYRRYRNLYFLGAAHAVLGFLLFVTMPDTLSHHLYIGPGLMRQLRAIQ